MTISKLSQAEFARAFQREVRGESGGRYVRFVMGKGPRVPVGLDFATAERAWFDAYNDAVYDDKVMGWIITGASRYANFHRRLVSVTLDPNGYAALTRESDQLRKYGDDQGLQTFRMQTTTGPVEIQAGNALAATWEPWK